MMWTDEEREKLRTPMWCPVCTVTMKNGEGGDDKTYYKWGCCRYCYIEFVEHREERWEAGWRPSAEEISRLHGKLSG